MPANRDVRVGDRTITVQEFSGYKFLEATELVAQVMDQVPELDQQLADWVQHWADSHAEDMSRAAAEFMYGADHPRLSKISEEAWQQSGQRLQQKPAPNQGMVIAQVFPKAYRFAREPLTNLIALVATPNSELADDDANSRSPYEDGGSVHKARQFVLHNAGMGALMQLLTVALEATREELQAADLRELMGNLRSLLGGEPTQAEEKETTTKPRNVRDRPRSRRGSQPAAQPS